MLSAVPQATVMQKAGISAAAVTAMTTGLDNMQTGGDKDTALSHAQNRCYKSCRGWCGHYGPCAEAIWTTARHKWPPHKVYGQLEGCAHGWSIYGGVGGGDVLAMAPDAPGTSSPGPPVSLMHYQSPLGRAGTQAHHQQPLLRHMQASRQLATAGIAEGTGSVDWMTFTHMSKRGAGNLGSG